VPGPKSQVSIFSNISPPRRQDAGTPRTSISLVLISAKQETPRCFYLCLISASAFCDALCISP